MAASDAARSKGPLSDRKTAAPRVHYSRPTAESVTRGAEFFGGFKTKDLMELLHLDESAIRRLERRHLLLRERGRITENALRSLCRDHPEEIPFETLDEDTKQMLVGDYQYGERERVR